LYINVHSVRWDAPGGKSLVQQSSDEGVDIPDLHAEIAGDVR